MLNLFFIKKCLFCEKTGSYICEICSSKLQRITTSCCDVCGIPFVSSVASHTCANCKTDPPYYYKHRALYVFDPLSKKIIHDLKYHARFWITNLLAKDIITMANKAWLDNIDLVVPAPLHLSRLKQRGYNQSHFLAKQWGKSLEAPVSTNLLVRQKATPSQTGLCKKDRQQNLKHAFLVKNKTLCQNKTILLVDDVHTTGATLNEAAHTLMTAGAGRVFASTIAIAV